MCSLFFPEAIRRDMLVLFAFQHEIAVLSSQISEPMIGMIRLAWWKEAIEEIYAGKRVREHPVLQALADIVRRHCIPQPVFIGLIAARERDFDPRPFATQDELYRYFDQTSSALLVLVAHLLGECGHASHQTLSQIGRTWALAGMLRSVAHHAQRQRCFLPEDLLRQKNLTQEQIHAMKPMEVISTVIAKMAQQHMLDQPDWHSFPALLSRLRVFDTHARWWLKRIIRFEGNIQHPSFVGGRIGLLINLWWSARRGKNSGHVHF